MEINNLIFRELLKRGYALKGNTRVWNVSDSKLWYLTPLQAQLFLDIEKNKYYGKDVVNKEIGLIKKNLDDILKDFEGEPFNIIDLGCGEGKKAVLFIEKLKGKVKVRYCPIDISGYMVNKAIERIKKLKKGEVVEFQWNVSDFENLGNIADLLRTSGHKNNLFLLLGNTLGNFEINELLYEIRSSMKDGDLLLIGNGLDNHHHAEILHAYNNSAMKKFLIQILTQIGLKESDLEFSTKFDHSRVEMYFIIKKDSKITFQDKCVYFKKGDKILVAVSYKYDSEEFKRMMKMYFDDIKIDVSDDQSYALALCKK